MCILIFCCFPLMQGQCKSTYYWGIRNFRMCSKFVKKNYYFFTHQLRNHLEKRLKELEPLPEQLRNSEQKLLEATESLLIQERRFAEQAKVISDMSTKVQETRICFHQIILLGGVPFDRVDPLIHHGL